MYMHRNDIRMIAHDKRDMVVCQNSMLMSLEKKSNEHFTRLYSFLDEEYNEFPSIPLRLTVLFIGEFHCNDGDGVKLVFESR